MDYFKRRVDAALKLRKLVPGWLGRLIAAGIVSDNADTRRRQQFVNIACFAAAFDALQHTIINAAYNFSGLLLINLYNVIVAAIFLSLNRLHRYGDHYAAAALTTIMCLCHFIIVWAIGIDGDLHIYFTFASLILFIFGIQNWRWWAPFSALAMIMLLISLNLVHDVGPILPDDPQVRRILSSQGFINALITNALVVGYVLWALRNAEENLKFEHARSEALLTNILPVRIAERLKAAPEDRIADKHEHVTVLFVDLVGFTPVANAFSPEDVVGYLDRLFRAFDTLIDKHGAEKIKTIGDAYMIVGGLEGDPQKGAVEIGRLAMEMVETIAGLPAIGRHRLTIRAGIHCGPAIAGVIGDRRFTYDVWGDAVNIASRMESQGIPGRVQVSGSFADATRDTFAFEERGAIEVKGIGAMTTFLLTGEKDAPADGSA